MFHDNAGDNIGGLVSPVGGIAQVAVNFSHLEHIDRIRSLEKIS
jgi:hypothetical protein